MKTVISTVALAHPGGTESYCVTIARELDRLGHEITVFADELGPLAEMVAAEGTAVAGTPEELPAECDAVIANDAITAAVLAERYPDARRIFCFHSPVFDVQLPPLAPGVVEAVVAPSERHAAYARAMELGVPVVRLSQPIDTDRFAPTLAPRDPPRRALLLSHYLDGDRRDALVAAWTAAGIECVQVGAGERLALDVVPDIAEADIVVGKARAALEGMACGKAVYVFDAFGGDGWVTPGNYAALEADNFAGLAGERPVDSARLTADLELYDPEMGWVNRELAVAHHGARSHAQSLVELLRGPGPRRSSSPASSAALARSVRSAWRAKRHAMVLDAELANLRERISALMLELHQAEHAAREAAEARLAAEAQLRAIGEMATGSAADRDAWHARACEAERQLHAATALIGTRRVQAGIAVGRSLDRARRRL